MDEEVTSVVAQDQDDQPWLHPVPGEPLKAFDAFQYYLKTPRPRFISGIYINYLVDVKGHPESYRSGKNKNGTTIKAPAAWFGWRDGYRWEERAREHDLYNDRLAQKAQDDAVRTEVAKRVAIREQRKLEIENAGYETWKKLKERAEQMLAFPLTQKVVKEVDGHSVTIINPVKWTMTTAVRMMVEANRMGRLALGMDTEIVSYDFSKCTPEELAEIGLVFGLPGGVRPAEAADPDAEA